MGTILDYIVCISALVASSRRQGLYFSSDVHILGTPIDGVVGRGFGVTREGRVRGNLATDNGGGWVETVLSTVEGMEHDTD